MNKPDKHHDLSSSKDVRIERMIKAGLVEWNGKKLEKVEQVVVNQHSRQVSDILVEMRE